MINWREMQGVGDMLLKYIVLWFSNKNVLMYLGKYIMGAGVVQILQFLEKMFQYKGKFIISCL